MSISIYDQASLDYAYDTKEAFDRTIMTAHALVRQAECLAAMGVLDIDVKADIVAGAEDSISNLTAKRDEIEATIAEYEGNGSDNRPGSAVLSYPQAAE